MNYAFHAFSTPLLFKTLFRPWKMDTITRESYTFVEKFAFFVLSRLLGFIARSFLIILGLGFTLVVIISLPFFLIFPVNINREGLQGLGSVGASLSYMDTYVLRKHSRDLVSARSQKIYGKERALRMIERGLSKDGTRNVLVVGDTGVGKSALLSHLGRLGRSGLSFAGIRNHRVVELFVEGISIPDFDACLKETASAGNVIAVIENIHLYEGLYERLMPYLSTPRLGIIVTTDFANYDQVLKKYPEFLSKFEKVDLAETNEADTAAILKENARAKGIRIEDEAVTEIIRLAGRLIGNEREPEKSLSILEELQTLDKKITVEDARRIISDKTNIPVGDLGAGERQALAGLEENMKKKIIGQDEAVREVSAALKRLRTGISDPSKPAGSFLFLGPTGVGKTHTAKILAEIYFGRKNAMLRFDMSEFSMPSSVEVFTERLCAEIEESPLSLVFFDELEKAHTAIHHLLLQVLDEGRLTRSSGREASFRESLIIATSNAGSAEIVRNPGIGKKELVNHLISEQIFSPEFMNRFNDIILFQPLDSAEARKITILMLDDFAGRLFEDKKIKLEITDALVDKVAGAGFDPEFGARPIKRAMEEIVENKVAEYVLAGNQGGVMKIL